MQNRWRIKTFQAIDNSSQEIVESSKRCTRRKRKKKLTAGDSNRIKVFRLTMRSNQLQATLIEMFLSTQMHAFDLEI